ncbi:MAG: uvrA [Nitrospira sp.]|nr:uvrA [Nitrospira sp.]
MTLCVRNDATCSHALFPCDKPDWVDIIPSSPSFDVSDRGGEIVAEGPPREIAKSKRSYTGQVLKEAGV